MQQLDVWLYFLKLDILITTWNSDSAAGSGDEWGKTRKTLSTTGSCKNPPSLLRVWGRKRATLCSQLEYRDSRQYKHMQIQRYTLQYEHTLAQIVQGRHQHWSKWRSFRLFASQFNHSMRVLKADTHCEPFYTPPSFLHTAWVADVQILNIMEAAAATQWIYCMWLGEKKQRAAEAENTKRLVKIRAVKENRILPQFKNNRCLMGVFPFLRWVLNGNHKQKEWIRRAGQGGMRNTGIQPINVHYMRKTWSKKLNLMNATFSFTPETNETSSVHTQGFNKVAVLMPAHLGS